MKEIQLYGIFELELKDVKSAVLMEYCAVFTNGNTQITVPAFLAGDNRYLVRFMPEKTGNWQYSVKLGADTCEGNFLCIENSGLNQGVVRAHGHHFCYADGTRYLPFGTTCYAWTHQSDELQKQTLQTLKDTPLNKIRMCVFPKSMPYNRNDPEFYPFHKDADGKWDVHNPDERYWKHLDTRLQDLANLGIEADIILFHPYDRWGFSCMGREDDLVYLEYCIARLAAHANVWWSLANEYDLVAEKDHEDWDAFGELVAAKDPYRHLLSIHNCLPVYPKRDWMTHCSIQSADINNVIKWQREYDLPVLIDECGYEGDLELEWGTLSPFEMVHRFWWTMIRGGYCTHGETLQREDEVLWWAKGGQLYGKSVPRIAFLRKILEDIPETLTPVQGRRQFDPNNNESSSSENNQGAGFIQAFVRAFGRLSEAERERKLIEMIPTIIQSEGYRLSYFGHTCPSSASLQLPEKGRYQIEVLDIWEMTQKSAGDDFCGAVKLSLPGKEGMALLIKRLEGAPLN